MDHSERKKHFASLKGKYQISQFQIDQRQDFESEDFLYLILRKADLGIRVTELEIQWLRKYKLFKAIEIINLRKYQIEDKKRLKDDFLNLRVKYCVPEELELSLSSPIYSVLWKVDTGCKVTDSELELLDNHNLEKTIALVQDIVNFSRLKVKYKATKYTDAFPEEPLYSILKKLDMRESLSDSEGDWLVDAKLEETVKEYWRKENEKRTEIEFIKLKSKYQVDYHPATSAASPLYSILHKLDLQTELNQSEREWLSDQDLNHFTAIDQKNVDVKVFLKLKHLYKVDKYQEEDSGELFLILKRILFCDPKSMRTLRELQITAKYSDFGLSDNDIQWLSEKGLAETVEIAKKFHFRALKSKYRIVGNLAFDPFYEIMLKLEREERLDPKQVIQLIEEKHLSSHGYIALAHYRQEAIFYEKEHQRTANKWNLANASSNWRKAEQPRKALEATDGLNWKKIKQPDLKAALLVTRGGAFRDLAKLNSAESCAMQAMECQPDNYQPYTLMGAICYNKGNYQAGDGWFAKAEARGAKNTDNEIERIVRMTNDKNKRREVVQYLLNKDSKRYGWARSYLKK